MTNEMAKDAKKTSNELRKYFLPFPLQFFCCRRLDKVI